MMPEQCDAIGPTEELACTGEDEDCDGEIDEGDYFDRADLVFIIDVTGSMYSVYSSLLAAINTYANDFTQALCDDGNGGQEQCHKFSLILFPEPGDYTYYGGGTPWKDDWGVTGTCGSASTWNASYPPEAGGPYFNATGALHPTSLVDFDEFLYTLNLAASTGLVCGDEPSYDVLKAVTDPSDPIGIGWRTDAYPYVFFLGDEDAQTWDGTTEADVSAQADVCDGIGMCPCLPPDCVTPRNEFELHCFVMPYNYNYYDSICYSDYQTSGTGGPADNEYDIRNIDANILRSIFSDVCLQEEGEEE